MKALAICLLLFPIFINAQPVAIPQTIKTPYGNVRSTYYAGSHNFYHSTKIDVKEDLRFDFIFKSKNDSTFYSYTAIDVNGSVHSATVRDGLNNMIKIYPGDTKELRCINDDETVTIGFPADSCWLFKTVTGPIEGYSFIPSPQAPVTAIKAGDGSIVPLNNANLTLLIADQPKAIKLANAGKLQKALLYYNEKKKRLEDNKK